LAGRGSLDQTLRQAEPRAQTAFPPLHLAGIGFVIVSGQVQQAVQDEDFQFGRQGVSLLDGLAKRRLHADGHVAFFLVLDEIRGRERKNVGRLVFAAEALVQVAHSRVAGEQHGYLPAQAHGCLRLAQKLRQGSRGG
jgi:hypothetical protein